MTSAQQDRLQGLVGSVAIKAPVAAATTANVTLSGEQTIDGVALVSGDRVLVKNQNTGAENGIYEVDTGDWNRTADFDGPFDCRCGTIVRVNDGTTNSDSFWTITTADPITIGTTTITFALTVNALNGVSAFMQGLLTDTTANLATTRLEALSLTAGGTMTVPFVAANGTLAAPGIVFANSGSTGFRSTGANSMEVVVAGATIAEFGTDGFAALPTGDAATPSLSIGVNSATGLFSSGANSIGFSANGTKTLDVGTTGVTVTGVCTATQQYGLATGSTDIASRIENTNAAYTGIVQTIQTTTTAAGTSCQLVGGYDSTVQVYKVFNNGNVVNTNNSYGAISDERLKHDIVPATSQWDDIKVLAKMAIKYRLASTKDADQADKDAPLQLGLPARQVQAISPGLVSSTPDIELVDGTEQVEQEFEEEVIETGADLILRKVKRKAVRMVERPARLTRQTGDHTLSINYSVLYMKAVIALGEALERIEQQDIRLAALEGRAP